MSQEKKNRVIQANALVEARYRLTLQEKRFVLWLLSQIKKDDKEFKRYEIKVKEFAEMMGLNLVTQYKEMKEITAKLVTRLIRIEDKNAGIEKQLAWLAFAEWDSSGGSCSVEFHPELKPYLLQLKEKFTQIGFTDLLDLGSTYSIRLLEILAQYESVGERTTTIEDIRHWCGIEENEYKAYANLKNRVINAAKEEINKKTSYMVDYKEIKKSRKVDSLEWTISKGNQREADFKKGNPVLSKVTDFCKLYPDLHNAYFLLQLETAKIENKTLIIVFKSPLALSRCESDPVLLDRLRDFFEVDFVQAS